MKKFLFLFLIFIGVQQLNAQMTVTVYTTDVTCNAACNGTAYASVTGGTAPYTYSWSNGPTTQSISGLCPGTYTVTTIDALGGQITSVGQINQPNPIVVGGISYSPATFCDSQLVTLSGTGITGGNPPYTFSFAPLATTPYNMGPNIVFAGSGTYTLVVTDSYGCIGSGTTTLSPSPNTLSLTVSGIESGCNISNGNGSVLASGGTAPYSYLWSNGNTTPNLNNIPAASYWVNVTDNVGCPKLRYLFVDDSCHYVWPGDANDDAVADNIDILDIGIANGATGTTRANATLNWIGQPSAAWGQTLLSGTDYKFVDCNGDGIIDPTDTNAVIQNFGFTHNNREGGIPVYDASLPDLTITMGQNILASNSAGTMTVAFGSSSTPVANFYGLAFTLNFDPNQIDASTFSMNENGTWLGIPGTDLMGVVMNNGNGTGAVQVALTRLNHVDANGFGNIANIGFMTTGNLVGTGNTQNVNFTISNVTVISANEIPQSVNTINDSVIVADPLFLGISPVENVQQLSAYPNPFNESVEITLPASAKGKACEMVLTDAMGRIVLSQNVNNAKSITIQRGILEAGIYFCSIRSEGQMIGNTKLIVR